MTEALKAAALRTARNANTGPGSSPSPTLAPGPILFPSADGKHRGVDALSRVCTLTSRAADLPIWVGPLVLRRTFNTLAALDGVAGPVLRAQLGHA